MARRPQPPIQHVFEQPPAPAPGGLLVGLAAAGLLIASILGTIAKEIAARWRGIVIAHLFFLTLWMAIQVFFFATGAYWCFPSNGSTTAEWFSRYFTHIARCGPVPQTLPAFQGGTATAAPAPAPPRPPATVPAPASPRVPAAPAPSQGASPPAAGTPPASGPAADWSGKTVQNCWRNRSLEGGDCYDNLYPRRSAEPTPPVVRYYRRVDPPPHPCRRPYDCWPDDFWREEY